MARACGAAYITACIAVLAGACAQTDVVAYRALPGCVGPACMPAMDSGARDSGPEPSDAADPLDATDGLDASDVLDASDADADADAGDGICAAATCDRELSCDAPVPRAIVGDSCGDQPWAAPGFQYALCSCGEYVSEFPLTVVRDPASAAQGAASIAVDGMLTASGRIEVAGGVYIGGAAELVEGASIDADEVQTMTAMPRCDCSEQVRLAPEAVLALVPENPSGFDAERFGNVATEATIALDCGAYRVPRIAGSSALNLAITGHVVLVVEGDIEIDESLEATLADGALLELFVLGNVRVAGALLLGDGNDTVRFYALGNGTINLEAEAFVAGPIYAPTAELVTRGDVTTTGPIFVRRAAPGGAVHITYDSATSTAITCDQ